MEAQASVGSNPTGEPMKLFPFCQSSFDLNAFKSFDPTERADLDKAKNRFEALTGILGHGDWRKHMTLSFYFECPETYVHILTNANMFIIEHDRGIGILSGSIEAFESFVTKYAQASSTREQRAFANVFYNILNNLYGLFKTHTYKQLGDGSFTVSK